MQAGRVSTQGDEPAVDVWFISLGLEETVGVLLHLSGPCFVQRTWELLQIQKFDFLLFGLPNMIVVVDICFQYFNPYTLLLVWVKSRTFQYKIDIF